MYVLIFVESHLCVWSWWGRSSFSRVWRIQTTSQSGSISPALPWGHCSSTELAVSRTRKGNQITLQCRRVIQRLELFRWSLNNSCSFPARSLFALDLWQVLSATYNAFGTGFTIFILAGERGGPEWRVAADLACYGVEKNNCSAKKMYNFPFAA